MTKGPAKTWRRTGLCSCPCGCRSKTTTRFCVSCEWDLIDSEGGSALASLPGAKRHAQFLERVEQVGPLLVPILKGE
jgi:hypothetical protein